MDKSGISTGGIVAICLGAIGIAGIASGAVRHCADEKTTRVETQCSTQRYVSDNELKMKELEARLNSIR